MVNMFALNRYIYHFTVNLGHLEQQLCDGFLPDIGIGDKSGLAVGQLGYLPFLPSGRRLR